MFSTFSFPMLIFEMLDSLIVLGNTYLNVMAINPNANSEYYYSKQKGLLRAVNIDYLGNDTLTFELASIVRN